VYKNKQYFYLQITHISNKKTKTKPKTFASNRRFLKIFSSLVMVLLKPGSCQLASLIPPECHHGRAVKFLNYIVTYIASRDVSAYTRRGRRRSASPFFGSRRDSRLVRFFFFSLSLSSATSRHPALSFGGTS